MYLGKVIGNIWATQKYEALRGYRLMFIQPINGKYENTGDVLVAVDTVGAGPGEFIYYITASEAVIPINTDMAPVDASIVGIVDSINLE